MSVFLSILTLVALLGICYQDVKQREVLWFLFPMVALSLGVLHYNQVMPTVFWIAVGMNMGCIGVIVLVLYAYAKWKLQVAFFQEAFGLGDLLFFIAFAIGFPTVTFVVLFVFALLFSLLLALFTSKNKPQYTIPLAGYMSFFLIVMLGISFVPGNWINLYLI